MHTMRVTHLLLVLVVLLLASIQSTNAQFDYPGCFPGQIQFNSTIVTSGYVTGYPTVCINGTFAPICSEVSLGALGPAILCSPFNTSAGYVGTPPNVTLAPLNENDISYTVTGISCDPQYSCSDPSYSESLCANGYLNFTCLKSLCDGPEISLYNNQTMIVNGFEGISGTVAYCYEGSLIGFCDDGSIDNEAAQQFCNALGYLYGEKVASSGYSLPTGAVYLSDISCTTTQDGSSNCTEGQPTSNPACYNGSLDYNVKCSGRFSTGVCNGPEISLYNNQSVIVNGTETINGTFAVCQDGILFGFCDDGSIDEEAAQLFCNSLGYIYGKKIPSSGYRLPTGALYLSNISCTSTQDGPTNCTDGGVTSNPACYNGSLDYNVECTVKFP
ncbi:PREDICTED: neurotrypsin-like, partial [Amphimedon queenslandica]|uniref:SRCR domain-containing protein n=1 Tax=Amphimedon queenslandica TaxID=400682 RepID=A0A1X7UI81_AMPQE